MFARSTHVRWHLPLAFLTNVWLSLALTREKKLQQATDSDEMNATQNHFFAEHV